MKKLCSFVLFLCILCSTLVTGAFASTLQSNQATYQLTHDPIGTEPFAYSETESHSVTLVPLDTVIHSDSGPLMYIELFTFSKQSGYWSLTSVTTNQEELTVSDTNHIYHISTLDETAPFPNGTLDRGIWVRGAQSSLHPITITGELVDEWAVDLVNGAIGMNLIPTHMKGQDLRTPINRTQFAALTVRLYEAMSGQTIPTPTITNPFTDTSDEAVLKAYSMGFTAGISKTQFGANTLLTRQQAATMLCAVYQKLGGTVTPSTLSFSDANQIQSWAVTPVSFVSANGIISGYPDGRFAPDDTAKQQECLIMALRMYQNLKP